MAAIDEEGVDEFSLRSVLVAALGAVLLLLVLQALAGRRRLEREAGARQVPAAQESAVMKVCDVRAARRTLRLLGGHSVPIADTAVPTAIMLVHLQLGHRGVSAIRSSM